MINTAEVVEKISGGNQVADKNRERLTVYVDAAVYDRFRKDAERNYRSLSDHMNAILAEHYSTQNGASKKATDTKESEGGPG
jgi:hypothetical protein